MLVAASVVAGCANGSASTAPAASALAPSALSIGQTVPALAGTTLDGAALSLATLRGQPVIVNFWASWCGPCRDEFARFKSALTRHASQGLRVVGVVFKDDAGAASAFAKSEGATWPSLPDGSGSIASAFRVLAPPQTYFVDRNGVVRGRQLGEIVSDAEMDQLLVTILS